MRGFPALVRALTYSSRAFGGVKSNTKSTFSSLHKSANVLKAIAFVAKLLAKSLVFKKSREKTP